MVIEAGAGQVISTCVGCTLSGFHAKKKLMHTLTLDEAQMTDISLIV